MRSRKKGQVNARGKENHLINMIDLLHKCKREAKKFFRLVNHKDFAGDVRRQNEAGKLARGIYLKLSALKAAGYFENDEAEQFQDAIIAFAGHFRTLFEKQQLAIELTGGGGGPITHAFALTGEDRKLLEKVADRIKIEIINSHLKGAE